MQNDFEAAKVKWSILAICGLWNSFEQWTRIMLPFAQWQLEPRPGVYNSLILNSIANTAQFVGTVAIAHLIDSIGARKAALLDTLFASAYQAVYPAIVNFYLFAALQLLQFFNQMPTIVDSVVAQLGAELLDSKERIRLIARIQIPMSVAFAAGPCVAVQIFYLFNPGIEWIQSLCGIIHFGTIMPIILFLLPSLKSRHEDGGSYKRDYIRPFLDIWKEPNNRWTLLFIMMIAGPYHSYDQIIRLHLTGHMLTKPVAMAILALSLGSASLAANFLLLPLLQRHFKTQRILQFGLALMALSYLYLSQVTDYQHVMMGMPVQAIGLCLSLGPLSAQIMCSVPRLHIGKAAALSRLAQIGASTMCPLVVGLYTEHGEVGLLCAINILISLIAIVLIGFYGQFMGKCSLYDLPISSHVE